MAEPIVERSEFVLNEDGLKALDQLLFLLRRMRHGTDQYDNVQISSQTWDMMVAPQIQALSSIRPPSHLCVLCGNRVAVDPPRESRCLVCAGLVSKDEYDEALQGI